jgi:hypothetical protein
MAFVRGETRTAGSGSPAQQPNALPGLTLAAVARLSLLAACDDGSSRTHVRAKDLLRPPAPIAKVTVLQPPISYNGLRHPNQ